MTNKIAVLMGGNSVERDISLMSGLAILSGLNELGIEAHALDTQDVSILDLKKNNFTKIFIALHGRGGEDGTLQAVLDFLQIPYTGSGFMASAISMDKIRSKLLWKGKGLPVSNYVWLTRTQYDSGLDDHIKKKIFSLGLPLIIKPNCGGSSFGISLVNNIDFLCKALQKAFLYDQDVLIETFLNGSEYTVSIIGNQVLPSIRIETRNDFFNYEAKYIVNDTQYFCPSGLSSSQEIRLQQLVLSAWNVLGCSGWGRVDVMADQNENFYLLEVNTSPGMTNHSLVPIAAKHAGYSFSQLVARILELAN
ncbi:D-alanine--D-alanine ligase [Pantoea sp. Aalb]|uniref:D-alanine--D-alanine ligase n=1 Tax=Pantoea sp. Aalb TaxID=2576762 RepID=UPI0013210DFD|nr:D-alanine--D-alanine ligase [Pantoea sp. Aalb]MXP67188.1 D-alanine--D-alanine ligase [Pantoea sp. Aalb]